MEIETGSRDDVSNNQNQQTLSLPMLTLFKHLETSLEIYLDESLRVESSDESSSEGNSRMIQSEGNQFMVELSEKLEKLNYSFDGVDTKELELKKQISELEAEVTKLNRIQALNEKQIAIMKSNINSKTQHSKQSTKSMVEIEVEKKRLTEALQRSEHKTKSLENSYQRFHAVFLELSHFFSNYFLKMCTHLKTQIKQNEEFQKILLESFLKFEDKLNHWEKEKQHILSNYKTEKQKILDLEKQILQLLAQSETKETEKQQVTFALKTEREKTLQLEQEKQKAFSSLDQNLQTMNEMSELIQTLRSENKQQQSEEIITQLQLPIETTLQKPLKEEE